MEDDGTLGAPKNQLAGNRKVAVSATVVVVIAVVLASIGFVLFAGDDGGRSGGQKRVAGSATTTAAARTKFGCTIEDLGQSVASDAQLVDPSCTEPAVLAEYCNLSRSEIEFPGMDGVVAGATVRTYTHLAGGIAGTIVHYTDSSGPPGIALSAQCPDGSAFNFTRQDWERFNRPG